MVHKEYRIVKKLEIPEKLNLKLVEANLERDPILKTIRDVISDQKIQGQKKFSPGPGSTMCSSIPIFQKERTDSG